MKTFTTEIGYLTETDAIDDELAAAAGEIERQDYEIVAGPTFWRGDHGSYATFIAKEKPETAYGPANERWW